MNLSIWLDVAIGLTVIYVGTSLFATVLNEFLAQLFKLRGRQLLESLHALIQDQDLRARLRGIPAVSALFPEPKAGAKGGQVSWTRADRNLAVSYVDPNLLAGMLVSLISGAKPFAQAVNDLPDSPLKPQLQAAVAAAGGQADRMVAAVSDWLDRSLTMLGEMYKRNLQLMSLGVGLFLAILLNLDTTAIVTTLYRDKAARDATVGLAELTVQKTSQETFDRCQALTAAQRQDDPACAPLTNLLDAIAGKSDAQAGLPIGWSGPGGRWRAPQGVSTLWLWMNRVLGWLLTSLAVSLGAPFWFDLLSKFVNVRHAMRKPEVTDAKADS